ncbi:hypothetical protein FACS189443_0890 [Planctomycetales bacterium]|nr:hypothetical protein FACS189443_0890 [Planctomycetales bacterium]
MRRYPVERSVLQRETFELETPFGIITMKRAVLPNNTEKVAPEYESAKRLAAEKGVSVREVFAAAEQALKTFSVVCNFSHNT